MALFGAMAYRKLRIMRGSLRSLSAKTGNLLMLSVRQECRIIKSIQMSKGLGLKLSLGDLFPLQQNQNMPAGEHPRSDSLAAAMS